MPSPSPASSSSAAASRLRSIDVFRGATIVAMILVNGQFSHEASYRQLAHAAWHGWTFADTIFPCFLCIVGISIALSSASRIARGEDRARLIVHAWRRAALIFACGVVIDDLRVPVRELPFVGLQPHLQLTGVLQKIAVCYLVAIHIFLWSGLRGLVAGIVGLNLVYLGLLYLYPVPGCGPGSLDVGCNFPGYLDEVLLDGFRWNSPGFDPDGLGAILPAVTSVLLGVLAGQLLLSGPDPRRQLRPLLVAAIVLFAAGELLALWVPINKQLWTTSFVVLTAGLAAAGLAGSIWLVEGRPPRPWLAPLEILGANAITAYLISRLIVNLPRVHVMGRSLHDDVLARMASPPNASLLYAVLILAAVYLAIRAMDRRGWRVRF